MKCCSKFIAAVMVCCAASSSDAASTERLTAVLADGSVQLDTAGKASFANIRFPDKKIAEEWLAEHMLQQKISIETGERDRYGRTIITSDSEEKMLRDGAAMMYASTGEIPNSWFMAESLARTRKTGLWAATDIMLTPQNAAQHVNEFHLVEGIVTRIYENKTATYVNFGEDWHSDFSITIPAKLRRGMKGKLAIIKVASNVRVRGTLYEENGPMVMLNHADNLERY